MADPQTEINRLERAIFHTIKQCLVPTTVEAAYAQFFRNILRNRSFSLRPTRQIVEMFDTFDADLIRFGAVPPDPTTSYRWDNRHRFRRRQE